MRKFSRIKSSMVGSNHTYYGGFESFPLTKKIVIVGNNKFAYHESRNQRNLPQCKPSRMKL